MIARTPQSRLTLSTDSGTGLNIYTAAALVGTYVAIADCLVVAHVTFAALSGGGGNYQFFAKVDGVPIQPNPQLVTFDTQTNTSFPPTREIPLLQAQTLTIYVRSPNSGDTSEAWSTVFAVRS